MSRSHIWSLVIFFLMTGPGPVVFILNKYTVAFMPGLSLALILFFLREEIINTSFDAVLKNKENYIWSFRALRAGLLVHVICALIFNPLPNLPDTLIKTYPIMPFYTIVVAPIVEEVAYRKIIFGYLSKRYNFAIGAVVSSALFSVGHFSPDRLATYFLVGMFFCHYYRKSNTITTTIAAHFALNFISLVMLTVK